MGAPRGNQNAAGPHKKSWKRFNKIPKSVYSRSKRVGVKIKSGKYKGFSRTEYRNILIY